LIEKNITSISVDYTEADYRDTETGTYMAETAVVTLNNAQTSINEFWFDVDTTKTTHNGSVTSGNVILSISLDTFYSKILRITCAYRNKYSWSVAKWIFIPIRTENFYAADFCVS